MVYCIENIEKFMEKSYRIPALMGHCLEVYDSTLYGFFAATLSNLFFPSHDPHISMIATFSAFAAGFVMRPLGGLIFGYLGDVYGRKKTLVISMVLTLFPTLLMGVLPTFEKIGLMAALLVVMSRLLQGICVGGEYSGAAIFMVEHAPSDHQGLMGSIVSTFGFLGAVLATLMGSFCLSELPKEWGWRIPFLLGAVIGLIGYILRKRAQETPVFEALLQKKKILKNPLKEALKDQKINMLCCCVIGGSCLVPLYIGVVYLNSFTINTLGISASQSLKTNTLIIVFWMVLLPFFGWLSDVMGRIRLLSYGAVSLFCISLPVFVLIGYDPTYTKVILAQLLLAFFGAAYLAPTNAFVTTLFPVTKRYSAMAFSYNLGQAILGGTTPLFMTVFAGSSKFVLLSSSYMAGIALFSWVALKKIHSLQCNSQEIYETEIL